MTPTGFPADHKWFTRVCAAAVIADTLIGIDPHYPVPDAAARRELMRAKSELEAENALGRGRTRRPSLNPAAELK